MARQRRHQHMWTDRTSGEAFDLINPDRQEHAQPFDTSSAIGQYPVTVVDHANGMATFATNGLRATRRTS